jgi:hypothetical protein
LIDVAVVVVCLLAVAVLAVVAVHAVSHERQLGKAIERRTAARTAAAAGTKREAAVRW